MNMNYSNYEKDLKKELDLLDTLYRKLSKNREDEKSLKKFEQIMKSKVDFKNLIPSSKSFEGENLLTLSKLWMILILIKINRGKKQQQDFLTLVNSSLTRDLNEYEEYRQFYEDQCEQLFSDDEAITLINKNPRKEKKLDKPSSHEDTRNNYIYLLYRPEYFKKIDPEQFSKIKKVQDKSKSRSSNKTSSYNEDLTKEDETDENDEKGDRLNEDDMINVLSKIKALREKEKNKDKNKTRTASYKRKKKIEEEKDDSEDKKKKKNSRGRKTENKKKTTETEDEDNSIDEEISSEKEYNKKNKFNKKDKNKKEKENDIKKNNKKKDKRKKDSKGEQTTEEEEEEKSKNKKLANKKEKPKDEEKDKDKRKKNKNDKATEKIYSLLGLQKSESKSSDKEEKSRKSSSVPPIKKEKQKNQKRKTKEEKKEKPKSVAKKGRKRKKKIEEEEEEEEEDEFTSDSLSEFSGKNKYEDDLEKFDVDEKKQMEKEIKAALEGNIEDLDIDIDNLLEGSKVEGISLEHFNSNESDMDLDEY